MFQLQALEPGAVKPGSTQGGSWGQAAAPDLGDDVGLAGLLALRLILHRQRHPFRVVAAPVEFESKV